MPERLKSYLILAIAALALTAFACSSDDDAATESNGSGSSAAPAAASAAPDVAATPVQIASVTDLQSFRYTVDVALAGSAADLGGQGGGLSIAGAVILPDREQSSVTADLGFLKLETETIRIGDLAWSREAGSDWRIDSSAESDPFDGAFGPLEMFGEDLGDFQAVLDTLDPTNDSVNGINAVRFDLTAEDFARVAGVGAALGTDDFDELKVSLWIASDSGIPVRMLMEGVTSDAAMLELMYATGMRVTELSLDLTMSDLNSDEISIEPPI
ncbi:MAG TPA: hypothetical protein QF624_03610 [Dehalococcoidia bacterium]|nr:hypothetical protein [Dehalococcoidia bacterium]